MNKFNLKGWCAVLIFSLICVLNACGDNKYPVAGVDHITASEVIHRPWETSELWKAKELNAKTLLIFSTDNFVSTSNPTVYTELQVKPDNTEEPGFVLKAYDERTIHRIIWITPFDSSSPTFKDQVQSLIKGDKLSSPSLSQNILNAEIAGMSVSFCSLDNIPEIAGPVVLHLDPSYFNTQYLMSASGLKIKSPEELAETIGKKNIEVELITSLSYENFKGHLLKQTGLVIMNSFIRLLEKPGTSGSGMEAALFNASVKSSQKDFNSALKVLKSIPDRTADSIMLEMLVTLQSGDGGNTGELFRELRHINPGYKHLESDIGDYLFHRNKMDVSRDFYRILHSKPTSGKTKKADSSLKTNVLLITVDTLRADVLGCYGNSKVKTPIMDSLAEKGTLFTNAYCQIPQTGPSHASILTGKYPANIGMLDNGTRLQSEHSVLTEILGESGAATGAVIGGYPLDALLCGLDRGFDRYDDKLTVYRYGEALEKTASEVTDSAHSWLEQLDTDQSFFLWMHYYDPHGPYGPPGEFSSLYREVSGIFDGIPDKSSPDIPAYQLKGANSDPLFYHRQYAGEVSYVDSEIGRLISYLEESEQIEKTVIVLTSDHGESMGEHNYFFDHGHNLFQGSVQVPLIMKGPGIKENNSSDEIVESIDIMPTLIQLLGLELPDKIDGSSLLSFLSNEAEMNKSSKAFMTTGNVYLRDPAAGNLIAVVENTSKLIFPLDSKVLSLYDISQNNGEYLDIKKAEPSESDRLSEHLLKWWKRNSNGNSLNSTLSEDEKNKLNSLGYIGH